MIKKKSKRIALYVISFLLGLILNAANYYAYIYMQMDGDILMIASMAVPLISAYYVTKMTFKQGMLASVYLSVPAIIAAVVNWTLGLEPTGSSSILYGLGWALSEYMWFFAPYIFQLMMGGIAALVRFLKERKRITEQIEKEKALDGESQEKAQEEKDEKRVKI